MIRLPQECHSGEQTDCPYCEGLGHTDCEACASTGQLPNGEMCLQCAGGGSMSCDYCTGEGFV